MRVRELKLKKQIGTLDPMELANGKIHIMIQLFIVVGLDDQTTKIDYFLTSTNYREERRIHHSRKVFESNKSRCSLDPVFVDS
jgi:hypothetical protein